MKKDLWYQNETVLKEGPSYQNETLVKEGPSYQNETVVKEDLWFPSCFLLVCLSVD